MKFHLTSGVLALGVATLIPAAAQEAAAAAAEAPTEAASPAAADVKPRASYALGVQMGEAFVHNYWRMGMTAGDIEKESFVKGLFEVIGEKEPEASREELTASLQALGDLIQQREEQLGAKNLEAGKTFLEENGKREGIVTTPSGLQYQILEKGGEEKYSPPKEGEPDKDFLVNYKGTLTDGKEFDASPEGEPVALGMNVIAGFEEALTTMPVGAKWKVFIPSDLAYGARRQGPDIGPNSVLIFDLELVGFQAAPTAQLPFSLPGAE